MTKLHAIWRCAILLLIASFVSPAWASTVLTFNVTSHTEVARNTKQTKGQLPADEHYAMTVALSADTLQVDRPDVLTVYDFAKRRLVQLDKSKHSYVEVSLFSRIGFDVAEFHNRMMLAKMLGVLKQANNPMAPALTENLMSLSDPVNAINIDSRTVGADTVYSWDKRPLVTVSQKSSAVSAATLDQYLRFLRYEVGGHPKILAALGQGKGIPERLVIVRSNVSVETRTLVLENLDEKPDVPLSLDGYTRAMPEMEPFTTLKLLSGNPAADLAARTAMLRAERDSELADGHNFDAALANFVIGLSTGDLQESTDWLRAHNEQVAADGNAARLMASLQPHDEASAKQAVETLAALWSADNPHSYVLNIFEANVSTSLREIDKAKELFHKALAANPTITGAWIDLGHQYYDSFDADGAWACWDAARAMNPSHPFLKDIDAMEAKLSAEHPEFF